MQIFNNFFEFLLAPMEPKNLILLNFPKKAYHAHPPPPPHSEGYSPMVIIQLLRHNLQLSSKSPFQKISCVHSLTTQAAVTGRSSDITTTHLRYVINKTDC